MRARSRNLAAYCFAALVPFAATHGQVRTYDVNFAAVGPTIDGAITDGEWDAAADGGGNWTLIRTPDEVKSRPFVDRI